ncbi:hypothetical protein OFO07_00315 [Campylobacter sp. JMF_06 NA1]|nr:hypothetical protein [Campylobacter sp. JMF_06 NA1]MDA3077371.1 hypothetical protein [Campylobacter sp. JMF_06 NA1]
MPSLTQPWYLLHTLYPFSEANPSKKEIADNTKVPGLSERKA